jgi:hypothetical protein
MGRKLQKVEKFCRGWQTALSLVVKAERCEVVEIACWPRREVAQGKLPQLGHVSTENRRKNTIQLFPLFDLHEQTIEPWSGRREKLMFKKVLQLGGFDPHM